MTKEEILEQWRKNYKAKIGRPQNSIVTDGEILEQFAIELHKKISTTTQNLVGRQVCDKCGMIAIWNIELKD